MPSFGLGLLDSVMAMYDINIIYYKKVNYT